MRRGQDLRPHAFELDAGELAILVGTDTGPKPAEYLRRLLAVAAPEMPLAAARPHGPVRAYPGQRGYLPRPAGPGWALVGDAGYFKDPLTAHGITDALRDAELLARAVIATPRAGAPRLEALRDYEQNRGCTVRRAVHAHRPHHIARLGLPPTTCPAT